MTGMRSLQPKKANTEQHQDWSFSLDMSAEEYIAPGMDSGPQERHAGNLAMLA
jgi:hypothetical protein